MNITIGKYTLETLTVGMYDSPKDLYREYIQNSADSIDLAIEQGLLKQDGGLIDVYISNEKKEIKIKDNGIGILSNEVEKFLLDIGNSKKILTKERGFRGIGRLAGLAYCDKLIFETSSKGEDIKSIVIFDAKKLRDNLYRIDNNNSLSTIVEEVVSIETEKETKGQHYFCVSLFNVCDVDDILSTSRVEEYLAQVAPAKFSNQFKWADMIKARTKFISQKISEYNIGIFIDSGNRKQVYKHYSDKFISDRMRKMGDTINDIETKIFYNNELPIAYLWYAKSNFLGTVQDTSIKGLRLRKGNIQLGDRTTLNNIFKDERFNGWLIGELHILSDELIPNARRDNLEKNTVYEILFKQLKEWAEDVAAEIRKISVSRNKQLQKKILGFEQGSVQGGDFVLLNEIQYDTRPEIEEVSHTELINAINIMINESREPIKYKALELQENITIEQKKVLEKVFDILSNSYSSISENLIKVILKNFERQNK